METIQSPQAVVKIPLEQILVVPEDNPRGPYAQQEVEAMALSLKLGGQQVPILLRPRKDEERAQAHPDKPYKLVGGYLRVAAAPLAGLTALDAIVREMTPRQARRSAILDNVRKDMNWLAWGESAEGLLADDPDMTIQDAADLITKDRAKVSKALKLLKVLNKAAREAIRVNYTTPGGYDLPEACGLCLGGLATGGEGDQELIERAVKVALEHRLDLVKTQRLVAWVKKGGQPEDFPLRQGSGGQVGDKGGDLDPLAAYWPQLGPGFKVKFKAGGGYEVRMAIQDGHQAWNAAIAAKTALQGQVLATAPIGNTKTPSPLGRGFEAVRSTGSMGDSPHEFVGHTGVSPVSAVGETDRVREGKANPVSPTQAPSGNPAPLKPKTNPSPGVLTQGESLLLGQLAGIPISSRVKAKIKAGERPTTGEFLLFGGAILWGVLKWLGHWAWRILSWVGIRVFRQFAKAARGLARLVGGVAGGLLQMILTIGLILLLIWGAYQYLFNHVSPGEELKRVVMWPVHFIGEKVKSKMVLTPDSQAGNSKPLRLSTFSPSPKDVAAPFPLSTFTPSPKVVAPVTKAVSQPWTAELEDRNDIEAEIAAVPVPARIKAFPVQPDSLSPDMASRRLGDLQDPDKYSLRVGHDRQKVQTVAPAMTGLSLTYGDGLAIGGILGGPSKVEFYWEDVKALHCDEIKTKTNKTYQLGLAAKGLKKPFTVQCATADDLRHLVSALEFWIGAGNGGKKAPITGMPYLSQGLRLNDKGQVELLWADSPAASARRLQAEGQDLSVPIPKEGIGDLAALEFGDGIWSLDTDGKQPQGKTYLESALETPAPGRHSLYVSTSEDWGDGPPPHNTRSVRSFNPKRQKMELVVPQP